MKHKLDEIFKDIYFLDTFFKRFKGLMFKNDISKDSVYILNTKGVHSFFMKFSIYVVYLNDEKQVIYKTYLDPWKNSGFKLDAKYILETKKNILGLVSLGDKIIF
ncbi:MAG: DUF192 domain-containing protein [Bacillota bacterium]